MKAMKEHLSESQIAEWISDGSNAAVKQHLEACILCRAEVEELGGALTGFRRSIHDAASARSFAWQTPERRAGNPSRDADGAWAFDRAPQFGRWRLAQAGALGTLVLACSLLLTLGPRLHRQPAGGPVEEASGRSLVGSEISDEALLIAVETAIREQAPAALAPAELIAQERDRVVEAQTSKQAPQGRATENKSGTEEGKEND